MLKNVVKSKMRITTPMIVLSVLDSGHHIWVDETEEGRKREVR